MLEENNFSIPEQPTPPDQPKSWKEKIKQHKYIILIVVGIVVLVGLIVGMIFLMNHNEKNESSFEKDGKAGSISLLKKNNELYKKLNTNDKKEVDKIAKVFSTKTVTDKTKQGQAVETLYYYKHKYHDLSKDAQAIIKPYLLRPNDMNSYYQAVYGTEVNDNKTSWIDTAYAQEARPAYSKYLITTDDKIKVWYPEITVKVGGKTSKVNLYEAEAKKVVAAYNNSQAYTKFKKLLGMDAPTDKTLGGDSRIDVYMVNKYNKLLKMGAGLNAAGAVISDVAYSKGKGAQLSS